MRPRHLHGSPAGGRVGRRCTPVSERTFPARQAGARLSIAVDAARIFRCRHQGRQCLDAQDLRQGFRSPHACRTRRGAKNHGGRQGRISGFQCETVFRSTITVGHGRVLRRSNLWRQPQQGVVADGGISGIASNLRENGARISRKKSRHRTAIHCRLFLEGTPNMATTMKSVDAVMVGMGWSGSIMARELTKAGMSVVGLERGAHRTPGEHFTLPSVRDELKYRVRQELMLDAATETVTMRHEPSETALPIRRWDAFPLGDGLGGAGTHWNGNTWRFTPSEFVLRTHLTNRYGKNAIPDDMTVQDWGITYEDLEPHYDRFEKLCGTSGRAGNLRGARIEGGNIFEGVRSDEYPNKPLIMSEAGLIFTKATRELGYHPFPAPASNSSAPYVNPEGLTIGQCQYCGHCELFGCEANAKASPNVCVLPVLMQDRRVERRTPAPCGRPTSRQARQERAGGA